MNRYLRASFILIILLSLSSGVTGYLTGNRIDDLEEQLDVAIVNEARATRERDAAVKERDTLRSENEILTSLLEDEKDKSNALATELTRQRRRADQWEENTKISNAERDRAQAVTARWNALGVDFDDVRTMKDDLLAAREEIKAQNAEREIMVREINQLKYDLSKYEGPDLEVVMRKGLKGSIVAMDNEWDFVVVNVGEDDGARLAGKLMVSRGEDLIGKVQITALHADHCIANILPDWKAGEFQVGDIVLY